MSNPAKKTAVEGRGEDGYLQELASNLQLGGQRHVHEIGVGTGVNEDTECVVLPGVVETSLEQRSRGHFKVHGPTHQRPLDDW